VSCQQTIDNFTVVIPKGFRSFPELQTLSKIVYPLQVISNTCVSKCYWNPCSLWTIYIDPHDKLHTCGVDQNRFNGALDNEYVAAAQDVLAEENFAKCEKTKLMYFLLGLFIAAASVVFVFILGVYLLNDE
jgi:hypothetical protein